MGVTIVSRTISETTAAVIMLAADAGSDATHLTRGPACCPAFPSGTSLMSRDERADQPCRQAGGRGHPQHECRTRLLDSWRFSEPSICAIT